MILPVLSVYESQREAASALIQLPLRQRAPESEKALMQNEKVDVRLKLYRRIITPKQEKRKGHLRRKSDCAMPP